MYYKESEITAGFKKACGTVVDMPANDAVGDCPTKNWHSNSWGKGEKIFEKFSERHLVRNNGCYRGCPIVCGRIDEVREGKYKTPLHEGRE